MFGPGTAVVVFQLDGEQIKTVPDAFEAASSVVTERRLTLDQPGVMLLADTCQDSARRGIPRRRRAGYGRGHADGGRAQYRTWRAEPWPASSRSHSVRPRTGTHRATPARIWSTSARRYAAFCRRGTRHCRTSSRFRDGGADVRIRMTSSTSCVIVRYTAGMITHDEILDRQERPGKPRKPLDMTRSWSSAAPFTIVRATSRT